VGATISPAARSGLNAELRFFEAGIQRSKVMVNTVAAELGDANGPTAMIIGAAHTDGVKRFLQESGVSYVVLTPEALHPKFGSLSIEQFDRKNKGKWARVSPGTLGRLLNPASATPVKEAKGRKPPPIIETATAKSYADATLASILIASAARDKKKVPGDIWNSVQSLPGVTIDRSSFSILDDDVIFSMNLSRTDGTTRTVWARVGSVNSATEARNVEQKLKQAIADLGGGGKLPPTDPPPGSQAAPDEGPGDGKRGDVVISRTGLRTLAVYGATKASVLGVGKISG
jgi:hypothetical protein